MKFTRKSIIKATLLAFLAISTSYNFFLSRECSAAGGGQWCQNQAGDPECGRRAENACNIFCAGAEGCGGVFWGGESWCCPPGSSYCCSLWILVCDRWPSWGRFTCIHEDPGCNFY